MNVLWYATRGAGITSLVLLTGTVFLGIVTSFDISGPRMPRFVTGVLHRNVALLALCFLGVHIATTVIDGYAPIGWIDAVVPFASSYHPIELGLGTVAFDVLLALIATSLLRSRIAPSTWRGIHLLAYLCWPIALVHGLLIGTDRTERWMILVVVVCVVPILVAIVLRVLRKRPRVDGRLEALR